MEGTPACSLRKRAIRLPDGRALVYYDFPVPAPPLAPPPAPAAPPDLEPSRKG